MPPLCRLLLILALAVSPAAHAGGSAAAWIALGIWTAPNGDRVAWFKDPDGNTLSISCHRSRT